MMQTGLFDWQTRFEQLDNGGDPLVKLNEVVNWELFRKNLETIRDIHDYDRLLETPECVCV